MAVKDDKGGYVLVMATAPDEPTAETIAKAVVSERLAACCNIVPAIRSIYSWKKKLCDDKEVLCIMKSRGPLFEGLKQRIVELHPYDVPEVIAIPINAGHDKYLEWIDDNTLEKGS